MRRGGPPSPGAAGPASSRCPSRPPAPGRLAGGEPVAAVRRLNASRNRSAARRVEVQAHPLAAQLHDLGLRLRICAISSSVSSVSPTATRQRRTPSPQPHTGALPLAGLLLDLLRPQRGALGGPVPRQQHRDPGLLERGGVQGEERGGLLGGQQPVHAGVVHGGGAHGGGQSQHGGGGLGGAGGGEVADGAEVRDGVDGPVPLAQAGLQRPGRADRRLEQPHHQFAVPGAEPHAGAAGVDEGVEGGGEAALGGQVGAQLAVVGQRPQHPGRIGGRRRGAAQVLGEGGAGMAVDQRVQQRRAAGIGARHCMTGRP